MNIMHLQHNDLHKHLVSVEDFRSISRTNQINSTSDVELIDGVIYDKPQDAAAHGNVLDLLIEEIINVCSSQAIVRVQSTIELGSLSALQPDISLIRRNQEGSSPATPKAQDTLLVLEVADESLKYYYETKSLMYAYHGIPEYWLLDIPNRCLTVFQQPGEGGYRDVLNRSRRKALSPYELPDVSINISRILEAMDNQEQTSA